MTENVTCERCKAACKVAGPQNPNAKMLRYSKEPKGLCVNCAVHDHLRNTYPVNVLLQSGPKALRFSHIQEQFAGIMRMQFADAQPDEINWNLIIENWDLPFPHKVKSRAENPCNQKELDEIKSGKRRGLGGPPNPYTVCSPPEPITSFDRLNKLEPGFGDALKNCLKNQEKQEENLLF